MRVGIDCEQGEALEVCATPARRDGDLPTAVVPATHVEANRDDLLVRPASDERALLRLQRGVVLAVDVVEKDSSLVGTLVGMAAGVGLCALAGLYGESDFDTSGKALFTVICGGGGAGIGFAIDRRNNQNNLVRVYQREASGRHD